MRALVELAGVLGHAAPGGVATNELPVADFSDTPMWLTVIKAVIVVLYLLIQVVIVIWFERRVIARMQHRRGPNRFGPLGILQTLGDGWKLLMKEVFVPDRADKFTFLLAPIITASAAFITFAVIPMSNDVWMFGHRTPLQLTDTSVSVILALAAAGIGAYGIVLAGWSSGSTYPLLGGLRGSAQVISYEIAMGLSLVSVFMYARSMSTSTIVAAQTSLWFIVPAVFSFVVYVITMFGETNRVPFDLSEGEGELVAGYQSEYSGMRWGMFFLGEYINMFTVSGLATTMFLGGWQAPPGIAWIGGGMFNGGWWGLLWFTIKMWLFIWLFIWVRGTLPRTRYDQFMSFGWKFLIPATLAWVIAVAFIRGAQLGYLGENTILALGFVFGVVAIATLGAAFVWENKREQRRRRPGTPAEIDPFAGGYPVPPLPGQRLREPTPVAPTGGSIAAAGTSTDHDQEVERG